MAPRTWLEKADRYLASAEILLRSEDYDSCVSRVYYAVRYICLHFLELQGLRVDRGWQHEIVLAQTITHSRDKQWLRQIELVGQRSFARSLYTLLNLRGDADYSQSRMKEREARRAFEFGQALFAVVEENIP